MVDVEITSKISTDVSEAITTTGKLKAEIAATKKELDNLTIGSEAHAKATTKLAGQQSQLSQANTATTSSFSKLKESIGGVSPAADGATKSLGGVKGMFDLLRANPIIAVISILAAVIIALADKFSKMEAVGDALSKTFGKLSAIVGSFVNAILTPLIDGFVAVVDAIGNAATFLTDIFSPGTAAAAERTGELVDQLDALEDAERDGAITRAESNRMLQEARELAEDANVPIKERIIALQEAGKIEAEELQRTIDIATQRAAAVMEQLALELGARDELIAKIREGTAESLKAARLEMLEMKNIDKSKIAEISKDIILAEDTAATKAKIGKKLSKGIEALNKEQADAEKAHNTEIQNHRKEAEQKERARQQRAEQERKAHNAAMKKLHDERVKAEEEFNKTLELMQYKQAENAAKIGQEMEAEELRLIENEKQRLKNNKKNELESGAKIAELDLLNDPNSIELKIAKIKADSALEMEALAEGDLQRQILAKQTEDKITAVRADSAAAQKAIEETAVQNRWKLAGAVSNILNTIGEAVGKQTAVGKGLAVASSLIDTYAAIVSTIRAAAKTPAGGIPGYAIAQGIATGVAGLAAVRNILKVQVPGGGGGGSASAGSLPSASAASAPLAPQAQSTALNQSSINSIGNAANGGVNRVFVLDADVQDNAERTRRINRAARIG